MVKRQGKADGHHEQNRQNCLITKPGQEQDKIRHENEHLGGDNVGHNRADKESFFAFKERAARVALMFYVKRPLNK